MAAFLTVGPVFLQAPLVRLFPMGAALATVPLLLLALALALSPAVDRPRIAAWAALATTAWVAAERSSDLEQLLQRMAGRWCSDPLAFAAGLRFSSCTSPQLQDFERGYVKEGVGAGGLAVLWELSGRSPAALAAACDQACARLLQEIGRAHV